MSGCASCRCSRSTEPAASGDALRAYQEARLELLEEYGLEPGDGLRTLERMIIAHDPALQRHAAGAGRAHTEPGRRTGRPARVGGDGRR